MNIRRWWQRSREDIELDEEMAAHLAQEIDDNLARGLTPEEAGRQARLKFGNPRRIRETVWEANRLAWLEDSIRDLRHAARTLARTPGFTLVAVLIMAIGIGANTALFTVVRAVLINPLPFREPDRLVQLYEKSPNGERAYSYVAPGMYAAWKQQAPSVKQMGIYGTDSINLSGGANGSEGGLPEKIRFGQASWDLFAVLGVEPALGRLFSAADDRPQGSATVVLTHSLWLRRYGGDPSIVGRTVLLDAVPYTVVGILPAWFSYPDTTIQLWTALYHDHRPAEMQVVDNHGYFVVARLLPHANLRQAVSEIDTAEKRVHMDHPTPSTGTAANGRSLLDGLVNESSTQLYVLLAATTCVLLIACLNVANVLLARAAAHRKEIAVRAALGGSRWRLLREKVAESGVLSLAGGTVGVPFAWLSTRWLIHSRPDLPRVETIHTDAVVLLFGIGMIVFTGLLAGLIPALSLFRAPLLDGLQESSRSSSTGAGTARSRKILLAFEVAFTVVLLVCSGLLLKSYERLRSRDLGCDTHNVLTMQFSLPAVRYNNPQKVASFYEELLGRLRSLPGVRAAGISTALPGQGYGGDTRFTIPEHPVPPKDAMQVAQVRAVDPGYFQAIGIPLVRGRYFQDRERGKDAHVGLVSESFARQFFPNDDPIGRHFRPRSFEGQSFEIIGIVRDTLWNLTEPVGATIYFPLFSGEWQSASIAVRSDQEVSSLALPIQKSLAQLDADLPVSDILTMEQFIGKSTLDASFTSLVMLSFAAMTLLLAAIGLYGVLSYLVTQRTLEIGIRIALGSQRGMVLRHVLLDGLQPAWAGLIIGLAVSALAVQLIRSLLYGLSPLDWSVFASVASLLGMVAVIACALPAWRASRLDPVQALRTE